MCTFTQADRILVVGHIPMVHTLSVVCTNHIVMTAHTSEVRWSPSPIKVQRAIHSVTLPRCTHTVLTTNARAGSRIFRRGDVDPFWGGFGLQRGHFSVKMYAKMKELGPVGGAYAGTPPPPRSAYEC